MTLNLERQKFVLFFLPVAVAPKHPAIPQHGHMKCKLWPRDQTLAKSRKIEHSLLR